jgi:DNA polymerase III delta prime subunit
MSFETKSKHSPRKRSHSRLAGIKSSSLTKLIGRHHLKSLDYVSDIDTVNSMTAGAQQALRRTMEIYSNTTRFCLACNLANKIIEPIQSRCAILRYAKLRDTEVLKRLLEICELEKVPFSLIPLTRAELTDCRSNTMTMVLRP